jgi:uncharacterized lipoprotein YmbA
MNRHSLPGRRRLLALTLPVLAAACGTSADPALYTIAVKPGPVLPAGPPVVQLREISLARYLDRREIVRSSDGTRLEVARNDWWGEPLGGLLARVLVVGLSQRLPQSNIYSEGSAISGDPNAVLAVNIQRLDVDQSGTLELLAQAAVEFNRPKRSAARTYRITRTLPAATVAGQVTAISDAVAELTDGLAALLQR